MKRNFKLLVAVLVLAVMVLTLASCDVINGVIDKIKPHEHEYSADWSSDATNHWHAALCDDAEPADVAAHTFAEGVCSVCGYEKPVEETPVCTHEAMTSEVVKEATCTEAGEKKFTCTDCGYSYTKEIAILDHTIEKLEAVEPTCTETGLGKGEKCSVCGTILKAQSVIDTIPHEFVDGLCTFGCGNIAEGYEWAEVVYTLLPDELEEFSSTADGELRYLGTNGFFTVICKSGTKIDYFDADNHSAKVFEDGFEATKRLSLNGKINWKDGKVTKTGMEITVNSAATVKIWWVSGDAGRYVAIQDVTKTSKDFVAVSAKTEEVVKGELLIDTFELPEAGSYYIGNQVGNNYYAKIEVTTKTLVKVEDNQGSDLNGEGTYSEPYILPALGDYVCAYPGGYDLVYYAYTVDSDCYLTLSSNYTGSAWLKAGTDIYNLANNEGSGADMKVLALAGSTVYFGVADWNEQVCEVPFTVSSETVTFGTWDHVVDTWTGEITPFWSTIDYTITINADGTGNINENGGYFSADYPITKILVIENTVMFIAADENGNSPACTTFTYDEENDALVSDSGTLTRGEASGSDEPKPEVSYDTVIVIGANTLYFSADEISANTATRKLTITVAGNYKFASGNLFVAGVVDANGNAVAQNDDYTYTLAEGEYTLTFGMLSMFGVAADTACELGVTIPEAVDPGTGDGGNDEYPEFVVDELKEAVLGWYEFTGYSIGLYTNYDLGMYLANVYGEGFDLYFTFDVNANDDGSYTITLSHYYVDYETNPDMIETILGYNIVIGGASEEPVEATDITTLPGTGASADPFVITESNHYFLTNVNTYPGYLVSFGSDKDITVTIKADIAELYSKSWATKYAEENKEYTFTVKAGETLAMWVVMESVTAEKVVISVSIKDAEVTEPDDGGDNNDQAAANASLNGTYAYQPAEGQAFVVTFNNGLITVVRDDLYMGLPESFEYNYSPATGSITTEYGYFYVDLYTGSLYYGRGWLLAPYVVEDEPVVPTTPTLQLGDNTVTVTDAWNGTTLVLTATEAITYVITPGANAVVIYDYSNYFAGDKLEISLVAGASAEIIVSTEDWTTGDVVVNLAEKVAQGGGSVEEGEPNSADLSFTAPGGNMAKSEEQTFVAAGSCDYVITATGYDAIVKTYLQYYDAASDSWTRIDTELPYTITLSAGQELKLRLFGWSNDDAGKEIIVHIAPAAGSSETV